MRGSVTLTYSFWPMYLCRQKKLGRQYVYHKHCSSNLIIIIINIFTSYEREPLSQLHVAAREAGEMHHQRMEVYLSFWN